MISISDCGLDLVSFEFSDDSIDLIRSQNLGSERLDVPAQSGTHNVGWQASFETAIAYEVDDRVNDGFIDFKELTEAFLLSEDLSERVLEGVALSEQRLSPTWLVLRSEDPARSIFCFNYEEAER